MSLWYLVWAAGRLDRWNEDQLPFSLSMFGPHPLLSPPPTLHKPPKVTSKTNHRAVEDSPMQGSSMQEEKEKGSQYLRKASVPGTDTNSLQLYSWEMLLSENIKAGKYNIFHMGFYTAQCSNCLRSLRSRHDINLRDSTFHHPWFIKINLRPTYWDKVPSNFLFFPTSDQVLRGPHFISFLSLPRVYIRLSCFTHKFKMVSWVQLISPKATIYLYTQLVLPRSPHAVKMLSGLSPQFPKHAQDRYVD